MRCTACKFENPPKARFCGQCGASLAARCPACNEPVTPELRFCTACGHALASPAAGAAAPAAPAAPAAEEGERRHATVAFSDLSGYTALNERLDPEEVEAIMARIKREAVAIVERHGGTVNQFVGDEIMALYGVPVARRDDPGRAVRAAFELHAAVRAISEELASRIGSTLGMHTGASTGLVVVRRSDARAGQFTVTGDTVNTAARLRALAADDEVVVGADTWREISALFDAEAGDAISVKGKQQPVVPYRIRGMRSRAEAGRPFVGRTEELQQFDALLRTCRELGRGRVIIVRGDPGIGKTRLLGEFHAHAAASGFACHSALVLDFGAETGRDAVRSLARGLLGLGSDADEPARRSAAQRACADGVTAAENEMFVCVLLDIEPPPAQRPIYAALSREARMRGLRDTLCDLVRQAGARGPLMLLIEDVHWADSLTLDRIAAVAALTQSQPLLLVASTRFDNDPTAGPWRTALHGLPTTGVNLVPLSGDEAERLAHSFAGMADALMRECVQRAAGNPLFLEQLLLNADEAGQASLPGSIQSLVHARLDRLEAPHKLAVQAAAVLGQRFSLEALRHLIEDPAYDCGALVAHFLVRREEDGFLFSHALIRNGVYESLLRARRRQLHARAAQWFETSDPVLAAEHWDRAEDARAADAYLSATQSEARQFRYERALALAERGLELAADGGPRVALLMARGNLLLELGRTSESIDAYQAALGSAKAPADRLRALVGMASGMRVNDRIDDGLAALAEAQPLAEQAGLALELAQLHHLRGNLYFPLARLDDCLREHQASLEHARAAGSVEAEAVALGGLGDAYYLQGRMRSAHEQFVRCVALSREHGFARLEASVLHMVGWTAEYLLQPRSAMDIGLQAVALAARLSDPRAEMLSHALLGAMGARTLGEFDLSAVHLAATRELATKLGAKRFYAQALHDEALIALRQGDRVRARQLVHDALASVGEAGLGFFGGALYGTLAWTTHDATERAEALRQGEALLEGGANSHNHFLFRAAAIELMLEQRDWDEAEHQCERLERYTAREPLPWSEFLVARGRALARFGRGERSAELRQTLAALRESAARAEFNVVLPALDSALAAMGSDPVLAQN
ncbi:MAG TPA: AAA family ATPase [Burkholderiales bacterium]|nr:AAA family ATPase [Burkholderiales bacterium]